MLGQSAFWNLIYIYLFDLENVFYRLKKKYWGKGYATEVAQALIAKAFLEPEVQEIYAITMKDNLASRKVMEKCGMTFRREFHHEDFSKSKDTDVEYVRRRDH